MAKPSLLRGLRSGLVAATLALGTFLPAGASWAEVTGLNVVAPEEGFPRVWRDYPDMDETYVRNGTSRTPAQMRRVALGQTKQQLVGAAGQPVSANEDGSWNFNINLPLPQRNELVCQYRVYFDEDGRISGTAWRRPQCADIVTGKRG